MKKQILTTRDYTMFTLYDKNRGVSLAKVHSLMSSIKSLNLTSQNPIIINEKKEIVDGQHRFEACKKLGYPIYYTEAKLNGEMDNAIILLNETQTQWTILDYIESWEKRGKKVYRDILDCKSKYKCTTSTAISFVGNTTNSGSNPIRRGTFKRGDIHYDVFGSIYLDFKEIFKDYAHVFFVRALVFMVNSGKYDHKTDFKRFVKHRYSLLGCANYEQYIKMLEDILNRNRHGGKIYLSDKK